MTGGVTDRRGQAGTGGQPRSPVSAMVERRAAGGGGRLRTEGRGDGRGDGQAGTGEQMDRRTDGRWPGPLAAGRGTACCGQRDSMTDRQHDRGV